MNWIQQAFAKKLANYLLFHVRVADENQVLHCKAFVWNVLNHRYRRNKIHWSVMCSVPFVKKFCCHISKNKQWKDGKWKTDRWQNGIISGSIEMFALTFTSNMMQRGLCTTRGNFHRKMYVLEDQKHFRCMTKLI